MKCIYSILIYFIFLSSCSLADTLFIGDSLTLSLAKGAREQDVLEYYYLNRSGLMNEAFYD